MNLDFGCLVFKSTIDFLQEQRDMTPISKEILQGVDRLGKR